MNISFPVKAESNTVFIVLLLYPCYISYIVLICYFLMNHDFIEVERCSPFNYCIRIFLHFRLKNFHVYYMIVFGNIKDSVLLFN